MGFGEDLVDHVTGIQPLPDRQFFNQMLIG
jgi:hypothetical protein